MTKTKATTKKMDEPVQEPVRYAAVRDKDNPAYARYEYLQNATGQTPQQPHIYFDPKFTFLGIERLRSYAEGVSMQQNDSMVANVLMDHANCVVGASGGEVKVRSSSKKWNKNAADYINGYWADNCDWRRQGNTLNRFLWQTDVIAARDGDCLWVCDTALTDGQIMVYEADQLVEVDDFDEWSYQGGKAGMAIDGKAKQSDGVVFDGMGRVVGYFVTAKRCAKTVSLRDAIFVPASAAYLFVSERYRANQHRGESRLLSLMTILQHNRKMLESTVISAQRMAEDIAVKKIKSPLTSMMSLDQRAQFGFPATAPNYTPIGGGEVTIGIEDSYEVLSNPKPESNLTDFASWWRRVVYKRFGMCDSIANGKIASSDAGKSEMILTHIAISSDQKNLEGLVRWVVRKALDYAVSKSELSRPNADAEWYQVEVIWPELPTTEFDLTQADVIARLRTGGSSFKSAYGPKWSDTIEEYAEELEYLRANGMEHLEIFNTVAGKSVELDKEPKPAPAQPDTSTKENETNG